MSIDAITLFSSWLLPANYSAIVCCCCCCFPVSGLSSSIVSEAKAQKTELGMKGADKPPQKGPQGGST